MDSRGFRNNNPLNLSWRADDVWQGLDEPPCDTPPKGYTALCRFTDPVWGIRAAARQLLAYQDRHKLRTTRQIITRWAPPGVDDNHTMSYIAMVATRIGKTPDEPLNLHSYADLKPLVEAMIDFENTGHGHPYSPQQIDRALELAGVPKPKPKALADTEVIAAASTTTGTTGLVGVGAVQDQIQDAGNALSPYAYMSKWIMFACLALTLIGVGLGIYTTMRRRKGP